MKALHLFNKLVYQLMFVITLVVVIFAGQSRASATAPDREHLNGGYSVLRLLLEDEQHLTLIRRTKTVLTFSGISDGSRKLVDEIAEASLAVQIKLLRFLQEREIMPVGDTKTQKDDVRVIAATNSDLKKSVREGTFREDLLYRLSVVEIEIPPLRQMQEDILPLSRFFVKKIGKELKIDNLRLDSSCLDILMNYPWYGNIRELEHIIEGILAMADENKQRITPLDVKSMLGIHKDVDTNTDREALIYDAATISMEQYEKFAIHQALRLAKGNKAKAAEILSISRKSLYRKLKQYDIAD